MGLLSLQLADLNSYIREMNFPVLETLVLLVLTAITFFRRELSSNSKYREKSSNSSSSSSSGRGSMAMAVSVQQLMDPASLSSMVMQAEVIRSPFTSMERMRQEVVDTLRDKLNEYANYPFDTMVPRRESEDLGSRRSLELANDIVLHVIKYLDVKDIVTLTEVDFKLGFMCSSDSLWKRRWLEDYSAVWQDEFLQSLLAERGITWTPNDAPVQGWKRFYIEFEYAWLGCVLAGFNTEDRCLVALADKILDVSEFVPSHPGSSETLLDLAGQDATQTFDDIGHSAYARNMSDTYAKLRIPDPRRQEFPVGFLTKMRRERAAVVELAKKGMVTSVITRARKSDQRAACMDGHRGCVRSYFSPFEHQWYVWWSCCGMQQPIDQARLDATHKKGVSVSDLMPIIAGVAGWQ